MSSYWQVNKKQIQRYEFPVRKTGAHSGVEYVAPAPEFGKKGKKKDEEGKIKEKGNGKNLTYFQNLLVASLSLFPIFQHCM